MSDKVVNNADINDKYMEKILIVDDNKYLRYTLTELLKEAGYQSTAVEDGQKAIAEVKRNSYGLVILDMKLPGMDGLEILRKIKKIHNLMPIIMLTAFGDVKSAVEAMKQGAQDYITKPFDNDAMMLTIKKTLEMKYLTQEVNLLRKKMDDINKPAEVIGESKSMKKVLEQVDIVAPTNLTVLIQGESGTGKEVIANMIHRSSDRRDKAFVAVDCGAIPESLIESELFGHEKGAFTDARTQKEGKFEIANGGIVFLDEVTNLSEPNQIKLLRVLQERKVTRLGGKKTIDLDVRIIAASNMKLSTAVNIRNFRQDLYYRLNEFHLDLPPLRERKEDIPIFVKYFIKDANRELNKNIQKVSPNVMEKFTAHSWPGNVRELRNVIRRAVLLTQGDTISSINIPDEITDQLPFDGGASSEALSIGDSTKALEKELILKALNEAGGNKSKAAKMLNMNERTFYRKIRNLGI